MGFLALLCYTEFARLPLPAAIIMAQRLRPPTHLSFSLFLGEFHPHSQSRTDCRLWYFRHNSPQIVSRAVASDEVIDIFSAAGLKKPDISILSDQFLAEIRGMPHRSEVLHRGHSEVWG